MCIYAIVYGIGVANLLARNMNYLISVLQSVNCQTVTSLQKLSLFALVVIAMSHLGK